MYSLYYNDNVIYNKVEFNLFTPCFSERSMLKYLNMISKENKAKAISKTARSKEDVGSPEAQVAILTARIEEVTAHLKNNKHDFMARRGLLQMVGRRKKLLKSLEKNDFASYKKVVEKLGLRK